MTDLPCWLTAIITYLIITGLVGLSFSFYLWIKPDSAFHNPRDKDDQP